MQISRGRLKSTHVCDHGIELCSRCIPLPSHCYRMRSCALLKLFESELTTFTCTVVPTTGATARTWREQPWWEVGSTGAGAVVDDGHHPSAPLFSVLTHHFSWRVLIGGAGLTSLMLWLRRGTTGRPLEQKLRVTVAACNEAMLRVMLRALFGSEERRVTCRCRERRQSE